MYKDKTVAVVMPAYNEGTLIAEALGGIPAYIDRIYVVNDGSRDGTRAAAAAALGGRGLLIDHGVNRGVGAAIASGYKAALKEGMDIAVVMAGDNQMDPSYLPRLLDPIAAARADYVKGDRVSQRRFARGMTPWRRFGNWLLKWLTRIASGNFRLIDPQDGYTAISRDCLLRLELDEIYPFYGYCNDLLVKLHALGARILEVPRPYSYTDRACSKIKYRTYIPRVSLMLLRGFLRRLTREKGYQPSAGYQPPTVLETEN